ncbi:MAG: phage holin family protein [Xanthomonadales bacterium]|nr:phage holin family protein [Xanthomonadales bacterium]MDH3941556.1 phage holin family protein [Xanthomonadales bacterium]MDH4002803.1 phage holin family protein [Xanthomonadales bacterium]
MERFAHSFKVFWRAERLLKRNELRLTVTKVQLTAIASLVGLFGLLMLTLAAFFALTPIWGQAGAALAVAGIDLTLAVIIMAWAVSLKPADEARMVQEVRDMALSDMEHELSLANAEIRAFRKEIVQLVRHPVDALLPGIIGPLLSGAAKGLKTRKAKKND